MITSKEQLIEKYAECYLLEPFNPVDVAQISAIKTGSQMSGMFMEWLKLYLEDNDKVSCAFQHNTGVTHGMDYRQYYFRIIGKPCTGGELKTYHMSELTDDLAHLGDYERSIDDVIKTLNASDKIAGEITEISGVWVDCHNDPIYTYKNVCAYLVTTYDDEEDYTGVETSIIVNIREIGKQRTYKIPLKI